MSLFKNVTHQDIWIEHNCERCARLPGPCPIIAKVVASANPRKPVEWERNPRKNALMQDSIKCKAKVTKLPTGRRVVNEDVPMFDVTAPIDMDGDHA
jgi:hypothetical protein